MPGRSRLPRPQSRVDGAAGALERRYKRDRFLDGFQDSRGGYANEVKRTKTTDLSARRESPGEVQAFDAFTSRSLRLEPQFCERRRSPRIPERTTLAKRYYKMREMPGGAQASSRVRPHRLRVRSLRESCVSAPRDRILEKFDIAENVVLRDRLAGASGKLEPDQREENSAGDGSHVQNCLAHVASASAAGSRSTGTAQAADEITLNCRGGTYSCR